MIANGMEPVPDQLGSQDPVEDRLVLRSTLSDMERLPAWLDVMAARFGLKDRVKFAVHLCLEEVVSNVIRHGYGNVEGQLVTVYCAQAGGGCLVFTVEDDAPPFNPLEGALLPAIGDLGAGELGGQGIRLLRGFADAIEYEPKPKGNRLHMSFRG